MASVAKIVAKMRDGSEIRYSDLCKVCDHHFGPARQSGTSHRVYKTPWEGDPRVNIQKGNGGKAKQYQVKQVLAAIDKISSPAKDDGPKAEADKKTEKNKKKATKKKE